MTIGKWLPCTMALLVHATIVSAIVFWPRAPQAATHSDFVAEAGLFQEVDIPELPENPKQLGPIGPSVCSVHGVQMTVAEVQVVYGLPLEISNPTPFQKAEAAARSLQFPHTGRWVWGGCCVDKQRTVRIYVCPGCERAEKQWKVEHSK